MQQFDPNADGLIDIGDIFYLINHFFFHGPPAHGSAGVLSGDANGDGSADLADIFYLINYIFMHGPEPMSVPVPGRVTTTAARSNTAISGEVTLGTAELRDGHYVIPVIVTTASGSAPAQALSLSVHFSGGDRPLTNATIRRAGLATSVEPVFETSKGSSDDLSYLVSYNGFDPGRDGHPAVVAEIDIGTGNAAGVRISIEPALTMLSNQAGTSSATVGNGLLRVSGTTIDHASPSRPRRNEVEPKTN
ncbi:MAG: dockerin type I domain-containing protein [Vicinamibacterales bacterium]